MIVVRLGGILYKIRIFTCSISRHILKNFLELELKLTLRCATGPGQCLELTTPSGRGYRGGSHPASSVNWKQLGGRSSRQPQKPKPKMKLRAGCEMKDDQKMKRSHHRSTPGACTALSTGHLDIGNWERPRRSASVFGVISFMGKFNQFYMILPDRAGY